MTRSILRKRFLPMIVSVACLLVGYSTAVAAVTKEQRDELLAIKAEARQGTPLLRQKKVAEYKELVESLEGRLKELGIADDERDRTFKTVSTQVKSLRAKVPISFEQEVAPILKKSCLRCHTGQNGRGGLGLDTFARLRKGGEHGALLKPGNGRGSLIIRAVTSTDTERRMPKGGSALSRDDVATIGNWINQGARFDGASQTAKIGSTPAPGMEKPEKPTAKIVMADGSEKISFTKDIAPWMANICMRCHNERRSSSGFSLATFEQLMQGGDSGLVVAPGNLAESRIWDLVGLQDPVKMPPGQLLITKTMHRNLRDWIEEGAKFDGPNPAAAKTSLSVFRDAAEEARKQDDSAE